VVVDVIELPERLGECDVSDKTVVGFDVLRASTTIVTALANGARQVRVFESLDAARDCARKRAPSTLLCGEHRCAKPADFDLGNSPREFRPHVVRDKSICLATTNGTRALTKCRNAKLLLVGALVNARACAEAIEAVNRDSLLVCAGTDGQVAQEDLLGAGAVLQRLSGACELTDRARTARELFVVNQTRLLQVLLTTTGGRNVVQAGLGDDVAFCAALDVFEVVPVARGAEMVIELSSPIDRR
jgi:2-phosphosulfolactate phosphatase